MSDVVTLGNAEDLAREVAGRTCDVLRQALSAKDKVLWVLSGGTAPMKAYEVIASQYSSALDWSKVVFAIGDERCVRSGSEDSNWEQIRKVLLYKLPVDEHNLLKPRYDLSAEEAAADYSAQLSALKSGDKLPIDLLWLGMGEDGHTLSLFPNNPALNNDKATVVPVHDSPKPPPNRISLSLGALAAAKHCFVIVRGQEKTASLTRALQGDTDLPVVKVCEAILRGGGKVTWLVDNVAASG
jgi:6-phosphogluconolactonase